MRFNNAIAVTVLRSQKDAKGNRLPDSKHVIEGCFAGPRSSDESMQRSDAAITGAVLRGPWPADLLPTDRVRIPEDHPQGGTWSIVGEVGPWRSPFSSWTPGFRVALERGT